MRLWLMDGRGFLRIGEKFREHLQRRSPVQGLARSGVEAVGNCIELLLEVDRQVRALGQLLAQQPIGVFAGAALPGAVRIAEAHSYAGGGRQIGMAAYLAALAVGHVVWCSGATRDCSLVVASGSL